MKQIEVTNKVMPIIAINFEEMKADLSSALEKFGGIEVTEYNITDCVAVQRELSGVRSNIDKIRLQIKKEVSAPIAEFESQMKELFAMVVAAEKPIKDGLEFYEAIRKEEATKAIEKQINGAIEEAMLRPEFAAGIALDTRWLNKTVKQIDIDTGIAERIKRAAEAQEAYDSDVASIKEVVSSASAANALKLAIPCEKYLAMVGTCRLNEIISAINSDAARQKAAEEAAKAAVADAPPKANEEPPHVAQGQAGGKSVENTRTVTLRATGTDKQLSELAEFMKARGIEFEKIA